MLFLVSWGFRPGNLFSLLKKVHETVHALFLNYTLVQMPIPWLKKTIVAKATWITET